MQRGPEAASQTEAEPARDSQTARADRSLLLEGSITNHTQINIPHASRDTSVMTI